MQGSSFATGMQSADLALQVAAVRRLAAGMPLATPDQDPASPVPIAVPASTHAAGFPWAPVVGSDGPMRTLYSEEEHRLRLEWAHRLRPDAAGNVLRALQQAAALGPRRRVAVPGSPKDFDELRLSFPHFREVCDLVWRRAVLAGSAGDGAFRIPPILLDGPPGVGKTEFAKRLADWLGTPMARVDMGALDATFKITGLDCSYSTGRPGAVWDALQGPCMSPVVVLDELDKRGGGTSDEGVSFLLALLESSTATRFEDSCMGLPIDASWINWIATSNDSSSMAAAVQSRFQVFRVRMPTVIEGIAIAQSVYQALRQREAWAKAFPEQLPQDVCAAVAVRSAREVWQALEEACANAVIRGRRELSVGDIPHTRSDCRRPIGFTS